MNDEDIDRPLGNPHAGEDNVKPMHKLGTRPHAADRDYRTYRPTATVGTAAGGAGTGVDAGLPVPCVSMDDSVVGSGVISCSPRQVVPLKPRRERTATGEWDSADDVAKGLNHCVIVEPVASTADLEVRVPAAVETPVAGTGDSAAADKQ
jgi:hypothetical protein